MAAWLAMGLELGDKAEHKNKELEVGLRSEAYLENRSKFREDLSKAEGGVALLAYERPVGAGEPLSL